MSTQHPVLRKVAQGCRGKLQAYIIDVPLPAKRYCTPCIHRSQVGVVVRQWVDWLRQSRCKEPPFSHTFAAWADMVRPWSVVSCRHYCQQEQQQLSPIELLESKSSCRRGTLQFKHSQPHKPTRPSHRISKAATLKELNRLCSRASLKCHSQIHSRHQPCAQTHP